MKWGVLCFALEFISLVSVGMAQIPENNPSWKLVTSKSDEFEGNMNSNKWVLIGKSDPMWHGWGISEFLEANSSVHDGCLYLKTYKENSIYFTGGIHSKKPEYHFGYYELRAKVPKGRGFWHAFWLYNQEGQNWYDEIDIFEPMGELNIAGRGTSFGVVDMLADKQHPYRIESSDIGVDLSADFHTFALRWQPDTLVFYIDGRVMGVCTGDIVPQHPMYLYIDQQISCPDPSSAWSCPDGIMDASLPQYFIVDYFRYYEKYECDKVVVGDNYDFMKDNRSVKKSYKLKSAIVPKRGPVVLKAETLELGEGFEVPAGAEFEFQSTECK